MPKHTQIVSGGAGLHALASWLLCLQAVSEISPCPFRSFFPTFSIQHCVMRRPNHATDFGPQASLPSGYLWCWPMGSLGEIKGKKKPALILLMPSLLGHSAVCDQGSKFTASVRQPLPVKSVDPGRSVGTIAIAACFRLQQQPSCLLPLHIFINSPFVSELATTLCCISAIHLARLSLSLGLSGLLLLLFLIFLTYFLKRFQWVQEDMQ